MNIIKKILKFAMRMEKDAQDFYSYYTEKAKTPQAKELFRQLAQIEENHYNIVKEKYDSLGGDEYPITVSWVVDDTFAAVDPHILSDNSDLLKVYSGESPDLTIIRMAMLIENDFYEFYTHAVDAVDDPDAKEFLRVLAGWEKQHKEMFESHYRDIIKQNWQDISGIIFS
jgi:rubrerythrin